MKIETPILKRLGPIPFWRGRDRCLDSLETLYKRAAEKSRRALLASGCHPTQSSKTGKV